MLIFFSKGIIGYIWYNDIETLEDYCYSENWLLCCMQTVAFHSGGRFPRARLQSPRPLRYLRGFQLALFPLESSPTLQATKVLSIKYLHQSGQIAA